MAIKIYTPNADERSNDVLSNTLRKKNRKSKPKSRKNKKKDCGCDA